MDLSITLDEQTTIPMFQQIADSLREKIENGSLTPDFKLPSASELGRQLSVSRLTIVRAYEILATTGYIVTRIGSGSFVSDRAAKRKELLIGKEFLTKTEESRLSDFALNMLTAMKTADASSESNKFNYGAAALDSLPAEIWKTLLLNECRNMSLEKLDASPETFGLYALRNSIAEHLCLTKGLKCSAEQVIIFSGSQQPLNYIGKILCRTGDRVAVENPSYNGALNRSALQHVELIFVDVDEDGLKTTELESFGDIRLVYTTPGYQDPTGVVLSLERRKQLLKWAKTVDALIVEDGWDSDYSYTTPVLPTIQEMDDTERVFYIYSFWKLLYPLVTISVLVVPPRYIRVFESVKYLTENHFSPLEQRVLAKFISKGHLNKHLTKKKRIYVARRQALIETLARNLQGLVHIRKQSAGLHLCVQFDQQFSAKDLELSASAAGLPFISTSSYYLQNHTQNEYLIPFALHAEDDLCSRTLKFAKILTS